MVVRHWRNSKADTSTAQHERAHTPQEGVAAVSEQARFLLCIPDQPECFAVLIGGCIKLRMHGQMSHTLCARQTPSGQLLLLLCCNQWHLTLSWNTMHTAWQCGRNVREGRGRLITSLHAM